MKEEILNKLRNDAGFGYGVVIGADITEMWVEYDADGEETWPSREIMEKFAEHIIEEILQTCEDHPAWTARMIANQIRDDFGVE